MRKYLSDFKVLILIFLVLLRLNVSLWEYLNSKTDDFIYQLNYLNKLKQISSQRHEIEKFSKKFFLIEKKNCSIVLQVSSQNQFLSLIEEKLYKLTKIYTSSKLRKINWGTVSRLGSVYTLPIRLELEGNLKSLLNFWCNLSRNLKSLELKEFYLSSKNSGISKKTQKATLKLYLVIFAVDNRFCSGERVE